MSGDAMKKIACLLLGFAAGLLPWLQAGAANPSLVAKDVLPMSQQVPENEYELMIIRLPVGSNVSKSICSQSRRCERKTKGAYTFYAFSSGIEEINADFTRMNLNQLQQYAVSSNYELTRGKYFSVSFRKSGQVGDGLLFEDINFIVKRNVIHAGKLELDVFGLFKYHMLGTGHKLTPGERVVTFRTSISGTRNFFLIAKSDAAKNEPV